MLAKKITTKILPAHSLLSIIHLKPKPKLPNPKPKRNKVFEPPLFSSPLVELVRIDALPFLLLSLSMRTFGHPFHGGPLLLVLILTTAMWLGGCDSGGVLVGSDGQEASKVATPRAGQRYCVKPDGLESLEICFSNSYYACDILMMSATLSGGSKPSLLTTYYNVSTLHSISPVQNCSSTLSTSRVCSFCVSLIISSSSSSSSFDSLLTASSTLQVVCEAIPGREHVNYSSHDPDVFGSIGEAPASCKSASAYLCFPWLSPVFMGWPLRPFSDPQCDTYGYCTAQSTCACGPDFFGDACQHSEEALATYQEKAALCLGFGFFVVILLAAFAMVAYLRYKRMDPVYQKELEQAEMKEFQDLLDRRVAEDDEEMLFPFDDSARHEDGDDGFLPNALNALNTIAISPQDMDLYLEPERPGRTALDVDFSDLLDPALELRRHHQGGSGATTPTRIADRHIRKQMLEQAVEAARSGGHLNLINFGR